MAGPTRALNRPFSWEASLKEADELLDHGTMAAARRAVLALLSRKRIPRSALAELASLARRARLSDRGVRLLHRKVRSPRSWDGPATDDERAQYAACINDLGASAEARAILREIDVERDPAHLLFLAFAEMSLWEYAQAVFHLERRLRHPELKAFGRFSSRLFLALALIFGPEELGRARALLREVDSEVATGRFRVLLGRTLLNLLRCEVLAGRLESARKLAMRIETEWGENFEPRFESAFLLWTAAAEWMADPTALKRFREARLLLVSRREWEDVRMADYLEARHSRDPRLLAHLYYGSPFPEFRKKVLALLEGEGRLGERYAWTPPRARDFRDAPGSVVDPRRGQVSPRIVRLKEGQALQRLIHALSEDFYKPRTLAALHERLFGGEPYDPAGSPDRIHQILRRFRQWAVKGGVPLRVQVSHGFYSLVAVSPCKIVFERDRVALPLERPPVSSRFEDRLASLRARFGGEAFSARAASDCLGVTHRGVASYILAACKRGILTRQGAGPATRYRFAAT